jgi:hypothetical protein
MLELSLIHFPFRSFGHFTTSFRTQFEKSYTISPDQCKSASKISCDVEDLDRHLPLKESAKLTIQANSKSKSEHPGFRDIDLLTIDNKTYFQQRQLRVR